ncbi:hypothetical protein BC6307_07245 [Sutcliffiella cohnii]|uniref:Uncharacterized protein n=1 Tax=Sutcliffiella cohnii TaxID=33932 RepID=A0A223KNW0_9BACI|nr:hypothetical protein BC6307_07245 [Sutcliffiella cohnii]
MGVCIKNGKKVHTDTSLEELLEIVLIGIGDSNIKIIEGETKEEAEKVFYQCVLDLFLEEEIRLSEFNSL